jgi:hypothetical protein
MGEAAEPTTRIDLASRISARGAITGVAVALMASFALMCLGGGLGVWKVAAGVRPGQINTGFWVCMIIAWAVGVYAGGFVAAMTARSIERRDGLLHGTAVWAGFCLVGYSTLRIAIGSMSIALYWALFAATCLALLSALFGGLQGARSEAFASGNEPRRQRPPAPRPTPFVPSPQST